MLERHLSNRKTIVLFQFEWLRASDTSFSLIRENPDQATGLDSCPWHWNRALVPDLQMGTVSPFLYIQYQCTHGLIFVTVYYFAEITTKSATASVKVYISLTYLICLNVFCSGSLYPHKIMLSFLWILSSDLGVDKPPFSPPYFSLWHGYHYSRY